MKLTLRKLTILNLAMIYLGRSYRKVDIRLHEKGNSNADGARPVHSSFLDGKMDSDQ